MSAGAVVEGYISLQVADPEVFAEDAQAIAALESAVAGIAGVPESRVRVEVDAARRLRQAQVARETQLSQDAATSARTSDRRLDVGTVIVQYTIAPGDKVAAWTAALAMDAVGTASVTEAVTTELENAGLDAYAESLSVVSLGITEKPAAPPPDYTEPPGGGLPPPEDANGLLASLVGGGLLLVCGSLTCTAFVVRERRKRKDTSIIQDAVYDLDAGPLGAKAPGAANGESAAEAADNPSKGYDWGQELAPGVYDLDDLAQAVSRSGAPGAARGGEWAAHPPTREESGMSAVSLEPQINTTHRHNFWSLDMEPVEEPPGSPSAALESASVNMSL